MTTVTERDPATGTEIEIEMDIATGIGIETTDSVTTNAGMVIEMIEGTTATAVVPALEIVDSLLLLPLTLQLFCRPRKEGRTTPHHLQKMRNSRLKRQSSKLGKRRERQKRRLEKLKPKQWH